ncbi:radical SAM protein [Streptomyces griseiscabiei]|uniref:Radical SAM protein n=1 Tax=Streptomyces griseiscabiei TaxID=2993540 RepID=A0ABU4KYZ4_9ACTN|nr:radical SAM protein [Streptomyces griseiscabiei]MBZ3904828.1 radical SAM protein [Streptomyces griseiscabiei]MDX2908579.1 radical SAM protein [Streptomyces griseiscabiei]
MSQTEPHELIRYVQIETGTACNYRCRYCPVAYHPRSGGFLPLEVIASLSVDLARLPALEQIYLNGYDEPTTNPHLVKVFEMLSPLSARIVLLTNGTRLTRDLAERIVESGANVEFDIHLSAADPVEFRRVHQSPLYSTVMRNLEDISTSPVARRMELHISMQGRDTPGDNATFTAICDKFSNTPFSIHRYDPNDRAGLLKNEYQENVYHRSLRGCALQNRTLEWLHINATGVAILCCQDYFEQYPIGRVPDSDLIQLAASASRLRYHSWTMGKEVAPKDYLCRRCVHAKSDEAI